MLCIKELALRDSPWFLSRHKEKEVHSIDASTMKCIKNFHLLGIDFLYQNCSKEFQGVILNEEDRMNMQLQVATFLGVMCKAEIEPMSVKEKFLSLVVAPDGNIVKWYYHLCRNLPSVEIILDENQIIERQERTHCKNYDEEHGLVLLLPFSRIKLLEYLYDYSYFSVVVDELDEVANKILIKKLAGRFNIGLTKRNFYSHPDQKLQWTMLNWCNKGCVGKLGDFYEIDNDNFANFRDNYRHWWFRLTWNFCESFQKVTNEEHKEYEKNLLEWAKAHHCKDLKVFMNVKEKVVKKRRKIEIIGDETSENVNKSKKICTKPEKSQENVKSETDVIENPTESNSNSSNDTIIYELPQLEKKDPNYVELPSMEENPILNSIIINLEKSPEPTLKPSPIFTYTPSKYKVDEPNCSKAFQEEEDVLLSIIDDKTPMKADLDEDMVLTIKKEEIRSQIFNEEPCSSKSWSQKEDNDFLQSLVDSDGIIARKGEVGVLKRENNDIDEILRESEVLLRE